MNVIRATLNKKPGGKRGRNDPIFNTYLPRVSEVQSSSKPVVSSSDFSTGQPSVLAQSKIFGTARRSSNCDSRSTEPAIRFPSIAAALESKPKSKEVQIDDEFLAEVLRTTDIPNTTNSSNSKISSHHRPTLLPLAPPSTASGGHKQKSSTSSGAWPLSTPSTSGVTTRGVGHSRTPHTPHTPKTTTSASDSNQQWIVAITEGRGLARGEVGLATMDIYHPQLILCQISDSQTYTNTLTKVNIIHPTEIIVPNTIVESQQESKLFSLLKENFPQVSITTVQRCHFSDNYGLQQIQSLCLPEYSSVVLVVRHKFYALASAAALLKFSEFMKNIIFSPKSLRIEYQSPENVMAIDLGTAQRLELVMSRRGGAEKRGSLLAILDHCSTVSGKRSLRANILQPPTSLEMIDSRLLSVTELTQSLAFLHSLQTAVSKFQNVEQLLWLSVQTLNLRDEQRASEIQTNYVLLLKTSLDSLPMLRESLHSAQTPFFHKVLKDLDDERFGLLLTSILEVVNEDARTNKGYAASQFQRCFAIKSGINGLLDLARSIYSDLVSSMHDKVQKMAEEFSLPLRASSTGNKGFHIQLNVTRNRGFSAKDLPPILIQVTRTKNLITCTTEELVFFNQRMKQILMEIQIMSNSILQELLRNLRTHVGCLYRLCENIAELDLLVAFAQVSSAHGFTPPSFGSKMDLRSSRHPILDFISPSTPVANDVFASNEKNFHIITGPNMGGKSVYIKQVALLQIMAQIGCFVPAESAEFRITKQIFSRIGFDDSIEYNASSFVLEMKEMQYILQSLKPDCLVIIDELCRSTDNEEGTAIAWVLCEELLQTKAFTFFTTHYLYLTKLQNLYPNVTNYQMVVEEGNEGRLRYTHKVSPGVTKTVLYGLKLAQLSSLPLSVLLDAQNICADLVRNKLAESVFNEEKTEVEKDDEYIQELLDLLNSDRFNVDELKKVQKKLQQRYGIKEIHQNTDLQETSHTQEINDEINVESTQTNVPAQESIDDVTGDNVELVSRKNKDPRTARCQMIATSGNSTVSEDQNRSRSLHTKKRPPPCTFMPSISQKQEEHNLNERCEDQNNGSCFEGRNSEDNATQSTFVTPNSIQILMTPLKRSNSSYSSTKISQFEKRKKQFEKVSQNSAIHSPHTPAMRVNVMTNSQKLMLQRKQQPNDTPCFSFTGLNKSPFGDFNKTYPVTTRPKQDQNSPSMQQLTSNSSIQNSPAFHQQRNLRGDDMASQSSMASSLNSQSHTSSPKLGSTELRSPNLNLTQSLMQLPLHGVNAENSPLFFAENGPFWQNNETSESNFRNHIPQIFPEMNPTPYRPSSATAHVVNSAHRRQSTPMVLSLHPDFERISRNLGSGSIDYNEEDNNFEE